ncbi:MAG TPA: H-NS histone family protein [Hyphomicrobiales bacterium]|nr:H-NS histone family protein [Hyphomicrobiales bacterium]
MARSPSPLSRNEAAPDFSKYTFDDLIEIKKELDSELQTRKSQEVEALRSQVAEKAQALGVSVEEVLGLSARGKRQTKHARGPQPPKYRGPNGELWSGKGPPPKWMKPLLAKGKKKEDFLIK